METKTPRFYDRIYNYIADLRDLRTLGLFFFLVVVLLISWSGVKVIETNYGLQKQIARLEQETANQKLTNENIKLENKYFESSEYLELSARKHLGLAAPGETVINVPKAVALSYTSDLGDTQAEAVAKTNAKKSGWQRNFEAWMDFLLHRRQG